MDTRLAAMCLLYALVSISFLLLAPFYPTVSGQHGFHSLYVGVAFAAMPGAIMLSSPVMPSLLQVLSKRTMTLLGCLLGSAGLLLLGLSDYFPETGYAVLGVASRAVSGVAFAMIQVTGSPYTVFALAATEYEGRTKRVIGELETCSGLSVALGPVLSAPLYDLFGFTPIFYVSAGVFLLVSPLSWLLPDGTQAAVPEHMTVSMATALSLRVGCM